jgi:hypothetical protein
MKVHMHSNDRVNGNDSGSPETPVHQRAADPFHDSPRMVAQRAQIEAAFGEAAQRAPDLGELEEEEPMQAKADPARGGLPGDLQAGIASLSGMDVSDVQVHRNSDKPAKLNALAYAQGNDIHLAPGQDQHLPHEAWHVVQQRQGRVEPTMQMAGVGVNDDASLEEEADVMGARALQAAGLKTDGR